MDEFCMGFGQELSLFVDQVLM